MTDKLKNCPFCGGESWLTKRKSNYDGTILYGGRCINTGCCEIPAIYTKAAAISKWNTRKPMDRIVEQLEEASCYIEDGDGHAGHVVFTDKAIAIVKGETDDR